MTLMLGGFTAFRVPVDRKVFAPGFDLWQRGSRMLRRLRRAAMTLPDRDRDTRPNDVPPEFFRFPPF